MVERAPAKGPQIARRVGYLAYAAARVTGGGHSDVIMTRDLAVASLLLRLPARAPIVYESHGYAPEVSVALPELVSTARPPDRAKLARLARRESYVWQHADGYIAITRGLADSLTARFGTRARLAVVPDGTRITRQQPHPGAPAPPGTLASSGSLAPGPPALCTIAYAGHLYAWKGVDVLLEAIARVADVRGLIVGGHEQEPDLARLRALAKGLRIEDRVAFTGHLPPSAVASQLARADIVALPNPASAISTHSTSPLKLFEYMAASKAIVASRLPSLGEVLTDEVNALLVAPGDADALADGIRRLVNDPALRARLGGAARDAVAEYSWDRRAERLEILFNDVLAPTR